MGSPGAWACPTLTLRPAGSPYRPRGDASPGVAMPGLLTLHLQEQRWSLTFQSTPPSPVFLSPRSFRCLTPWWTPEAWRDTADSDGDGNSPWTNH